MQNSLYELFELVAKKLDPVLLNNLDNLRQAARLLPESPFGLIEVRLGAAAAPADLSQCFKQPERALLLSWINLQTNPAWEGVRELLKYLTECDNDLGASVTDLGLEFDLIGDELTKIPLPCLFLKPTKQLAQLKKKREAILELISVAGAMLLGERWNERMAEFAADSLTAAPSLTQLSYFGFMISRPAGGLRLQFQGVPYQDIRAFLIESGLEHLPSKIDEAIYLGARFFHSTVVCIDITSTPIPRVGLEYFICELRPGCSLNDFLGELVETGLCTPGQEEVLARWPGQQSAGALAAIWHERLPSDNSSSEGSKTLFTIKREVTHIKLLASKDSPIEAKAYLQFRRHAVPLKKI